MARLAGTTVEGFSDRLVLHWSNLIVFPGEQVQLIYRLSDNSDIFKYADVVARDEGSASTPSGLLPDTLYTLWARPESSGIHGVWQSWNAITIPGLQGLVPVVHKETTVMHGDLMVVVPTE